MDKQYGVIHNPGVKVRVQFGERGRDLKRMQRKTGRRLLDVAAATSQAKSIAKSHMPKTPIENKTMSEDTRPSLPELSSSHKTSQSETKFENQSDHSNKFEKKVDSTHAALKREQSEISKSFPKTRPNFQKENTNSSAGSAVINNNHVLVLSPFIICILTDNPTTGEA